MTLGSLYQTGKKMLGVGAVDDFSLQTLLQVYEGMSSRNEVLTHLDQTAKYPNRFQAGLKRLIAGEPVAYIVGQSEFFGMTLKVNPDVLIPRPETEELVGLILSTLGHRGRLSVLDIGTGSGCIASALKKSCLDWEIYASDISAKALNVARENAQRHDLPIHFFHADGVPHYTPWNKQRLDLIVSNPPYIHPEEKLDASVTQYEPKEALFALPPTLFYERFISQSKKVLAPEGILAFEIAPGLKQPLTEIAIQLLPDAKIHFFEDINAKTRIMMIYTKNNEVLV